MTCEKENKASVRVMKKNGAYLEKEEMWEKMGIMVQYYVVELD
jgi:predicted acetyltransferase